MNSQFLMNSQMNQSTDSAYRDPNSLGLEKHVKNIFMQTQNTITTLNNELDDQRKNNEDLNWKLTDLTSQKAQVTARNKKLEVDLRECKLKVDDLLKSKNDHKAEILRMKKQLQEINDDWENKRKELQHNINQLKEQQFQLEDEKNREKQAFNQATKQYMQKIDSSKYSIQSTNNEISKYSTLISKLKGREKFSMDTIMSETNKFKEFLDSQAPDNPMGSVNNSQIQFKQ